MPGDLDLLPGRQLAEDLVQQAVPPALQGLQLAVQVDVGDRLQLLDLALEGQDGALEGQAGRTLSSSSPRRR